MKHKKIIVVLGIISIILLIVQSANAAFLAYTKAGYPACASLLDFEEIATCFSQRDYVAVDKILERGRCILLKPDIKVWAWYPEWAETYTAQIRLPGSPDALWTFRQALERAEGRDRARAEQEETARSVSVREWFVLKSFLWIKPNKTTKQEITQKYGKPTFQDEDTILYKANQHPDFKEWKTIKFIVNQSGIVEEIRAQK